jgi:hypothetical protein
VRFHPEDTEFLYPVGWLEALRYKPFGLKWQQLLREWRYCTSQAKDRNWRAVKNMFNGWMYEPSPWPEAARRCGTGWTRTRAVRSFYRHLAREIS